MFSEENIFYNHVTLSPIDTTKKSSEKPSLTLPKAISENQNNPHQVFFYLTLDVIIPPHNGIGSEEDSLGYVYKLVPKPPKKDFFKWVDQQISLRFTAVFCSPKPEDVNRSFIITYYLNDDSLQIYEPPARNSGFSTGKFLERGAYKTPQG